MPTETRTSSRNSLGDSAAWFLVGHFAGDREARHYGIRSFPFVIGRRSDMSLCLPFPAVSNVHAELDKKGNEIVLRDLRSTNGTFVNGRRVKEEVVVRQNDLIQMADIALRLQRQDGVNSQHTMQEDVCDQALALVQLDKLMTERRVVPNYQPIVQIKSRKILAYEVVSRSKLFGVETPKAMFRAAEKLNLEVPLSNMLRWEGIAHSSHFAAVPHLFVNTHPRELEQAGLVASLSELRKVTPNQPLTLEIHENAVSNIAELRELKIALMELGISLAFDDFGVGQSRLGEMAEVCPDFLKFDISLIRGIDHATEKRRQIVGRLVQLGKELGAVTLAEGVETEGESSACIDLGFELGQGYLFGRPAPVKQIVGD